MKRLPLLTVPILIVGVLITSLAAVPAKKEDLVVHEWGVFIRGRTTAGDVVASPHELLEDLPPFVTRHHAAYQPTQQFRPWRKPVLHFYGPDGLKVHTQIVTAQGRPLAYWPRPELLEETFWNFGSGVKDAVGMEWTTTLGKAKPASLQRVAAEHWWNDAREIGSDYLITADGNERFLFYEATAQQTPTVSGQVSTDVLTLRNNHDQSSGPIVVIANDGEQLYVHSIKTIEPNALLRVEREHLMKKAVTEEEALAACRRQWSLLGMYEDEADHIVEVWREDLIEAPGMLVISALPRKLYDEMFPITIKPQPTRLVRVGLVFDTLHGESDKTKWLPHFDRWLAAHLKNLAHDQFAEREKAFQAIAEVGDLAAAELHELKSSPDPEVRISARQLLARLQPAQEEQLPAHGVGSRPVHIKRTQRGN